MYSLGFACRVRFLIQQYLKNDTQETGVFDWCFSNFDTCVYLIQNIDIPLQPSDFYDTNNYCNEHRIINHNLIYMQSIHDLDKNQPYEIGINEFIDKYNRRLQRLKDKIMKTEKINFIHLCCLCQSNLDNIGIYIPTIQSIQNFCTAIYNINPLCEFNLHILIPPGDCNYTKERFEIKSNLNDLIINDKIFIHYLTQDDNSLNKDNCIHWSWFTIFDKINN